MDDPQRWLGWLAAHNGQRVEVDIRRQQERRSNDANRRYWGVLVPLAGHLLSKDRIVPLSKKQVHYVLASAFVGTEESPLGVPVPMETHTLSKEQFHVFTTKVEVWLAENGYHVPDPGEPLAGEL
jgi:hypothetical protein